MEFFATCALLFVWFVFCLASKIKYYLLLLSMALDWCFMIFLWFSDYRDIGVLIALSFVVHLLLFFNMDEPPTNTNKSLLYLLMTFDYKNMTVEHGALMFVSYVPYAIVLAFIMGVL